MKLTEEQRSQVKLLVKSNLNLRPELKKGLNHESLVSFVIQVLKPVNLLFDDNDIKEIVKSLEYEIAIVHTNGVAIFGEYGESLHEWYTQLNLPEDKQFFWNRYREYLTNHSSIDDNSIKLLGNVTLPNILNCLGNPHEEFEGKRCVRGLIIGDVQSGKTSTYTGLICKAADAGYKVAILLAGTTESLRQQTQERIDEGIIGYTTKKVDKKEVSGRGGVGISIPEIPATSYTSVAKDFTKGAESITTSLGQHRSLVMFVVKKNVTVLTKLYKWLRDHNLDRVKGYVDIPMLLIDDEADNASVNTKKNDTDPTRTNKVIRDICNLFKNSTYVGFTATPFANIFIDPDSIDSMHNADLFPENFIYALPTPSSYIGAQKVFDPEGPNYGNLRFITDIEEYDYTTEEYKMLIKEDVETLNEGPFYYQHKKEWNGDLPASLRESVLSFFIANVIRDLRGDVSKPRSMLINMSRFVKVQRVICEYVEAIYNDVIRTIRIDFEEGKGKNANLPLYQELFNVWNKHFSHIDNISYQRILMKENILKAIEPIKIMVVNGSKESNKLDYKANPNLRVITIGGLALSRGLTLEGLLVSYFYRNTATFDVLMQMGRWFGYRPNYDDLFLIWTSRESAAWYNEISESSEELKNDIRQMYDQRLTPRDFGLKVRNACETLRITAANKMRTATDYMVRIAFYGNMYDTPYLSYNALENTANLEESRKLAKLLFKSGYKYRFADVGKYSDLEVASNEIHSSRFFEDVPKKIVRDFLTKIRCSILNPNFNTDYLLSFIDDPENEGLEKWDVVFEGGASKQPYPIPELSNIDCVDRPLYDHGNAVQISSRRRVLGTREGVFCLYPKDIDAVVSQWTNAWAQEHGPGDKKKTDVPVKAYFQYLPNRKPVFLIMVIAPSFPDNPKHETVKLFKKFKEELGTNQVVAFAIGFPGLKGEDSAKNYKVNKIWVKTHGLDADDSSDNDEEYDG